MAVDATYNQSNYGAQGGDLDVIGSTGTLEVYGVLDVKSGGSLKLAGTAIAKSAAELNLVGDYGDVESVVGLSTSSTGTVAVAGVGVSLLSSTGSTGARAHFTLAAPAAGVRKVLAAIDAAAGKTAVVETNAPGVSIGYVKAYTQATFNAKDETLELIGVSATKWAIVSNVNAVALTTDYDTT
jgi:hypothetical protein